MPDNSGMAGGTEIGSACGDVHLCDGFAQMGTNADALEVGQADEPMFAPAGATWMRERKSRAKRGRVIFKIRGKALRGRMETSAQIMVPTKQRPEIAGNTTDIEIDFRSLRPAPGEEAGEGVGDFRFEI